MTRRAPVDTNHSNLRLASIPAPSVTNPFSFLLYRELERLGVERVGEGSLAPRWLVRRRNDVDAIHLHWPEHEFLRQRRSTTAARIVALVGGLAAARLLGYRVLWTVHNLDAHVDSHPVLTRIGLLAPAWLASHIFAHDATAVAKLRRRTLRHRSVFVAPHGNYIDWYPHRVGRSAARTRLGLAEHGLVFLMLGRMDVYKGVPDAIEAFRRAGEPRDRLVVAGLFKDPELLHEATEAAKDDPRIVVVNRVLDDDELPVYFGASDVAVLPLREATTSGSAVLALGFGIPVVATAVGNVAELVTPQCGLLVEPRDVSALAEALGRMHDLDLDKLGRAARARAEQFTWRAAAETVVEALGR